MNHSSSVFCVFLDATKAFDRVQYCSLFDKLLDRNVDPLFLRIMVNICTGQLVKVLWNGVYSQNFPVRVRTDLGTDSEPHPVHCRLNRYRSIFLDRHWSNSTSN